MALDRELGKTGAAELTGEVEGGGVDQVFFDVPGESLEYKKEVP